MGANRSFKASAAGLFFIGLILVGASPAWAVDMWFQQALFVAHVEMPAPSGGQFFTTNLRFTASEGANTTINVKCFNDVQQRVGPVAGVNVMAAASQGQVANVTPTTLQLVTGTGNAPGFTGNAWCWANNTASGLDFNVQATYGATTNFAPNGILDSPASTFIATGHGLAETSSNVGGTPVYTTTGGAVNFLVLVNPTLASRTLQLRLFSDTGIAQGPGTIPRVLPPRGMAVLVVPTDFGLPTPPTSGSVTITANGRGYLGWQFTFHPTGARATFLPVGLDGDNRDFLQAGEAP